MIALLAFSLSSAAAWAAEDPFRIVLIGDTGEIRPTTCDQDELCEPEYPVLVKALARRKADVILAAGDLYYGQEGVTPTQAMVEQRVTGFFPKKLRKKTIPIFGNHEIQDAGYETALAAYQAVFSGLWTGKAADSFVFPIEGGVVCIATGTWSQGEDKGSGAPTTNFATLPSGGCTWSVAATHHIWATSFDKSREQRVGTEEKAVARREASFAELGRPPDVWLNGHAHQMEAGVYEGVLAVTSGTGSVARCPKDGQGVTLADGTVVSGSTRCDPSGDPNPGVAPAYLRWDHGFTQLDVYLDHVEVRPWIVETKDGKSTAREVGCWTMTKGAGALTVCK